MINEYEQAAEMINDFIEKENISFPRTQSEVVEAYKEFQKKISVEELEKLYGEELLIKLFMNPTNKNNLCYDLEYNKKYNDFGSIGMGPNYKYTLFQHKEDKTWINRLYYNTRNTFIR